MPAILSNPCDYVNTQVYWPAEGLPNNYFIKCEWEVPYLFKCPNYLVWNQEILTCDYPFKRIAPPTPYDNYANEERKYRAAVTSYC